MAETLLHALERAARGAAAIHVHADEGGGRRFYAQLAQRAARTARSLQSLQRPGGALLLALPSSLEFVDLFWAAAWGGLVPAPLPLPRPFTDLGVYAQRLAAYSASAGGAPVVVTPELKEALDGLLGPKLPLHTPAVLREGAPASGEANEVALFQFTSGSLGAPKATMLSHAALFADTRAIWERLGGRDGDSGVSWVPLAHDMGLIGFHLLFLIHEGDQHLLSTEHFVERPGRWLELLSQTQAAFTTAPPFGYAMAARRPPSGLDLSHLRGAVTGAEPVQASLLRSVADLLAPFGFRADAFAIAYGMAECSVVASMTRPLEALRTLKVRPHLQPGARVETDEATSAVELVSCGRALEGMSLRVVTPDGADAPEREVGEVLIAGPSLFGGYHGDAAATAAALEGQWLRSGDYGFFDGGELFIAGRKKDVIIVRGENFFPEELEAAAVLAPGVRHRSALAFGEVDPSGGPERVTVVVERRAGTEQSDDVTAREVSERVADAVGLTVHAVRVVDPHELPRTASGKLQRGEARHRWGRAGG